MNELNYFHSSDSGLKISFPEAIRRDFPKIANDVPSDSPTFQCFKKVTSCCQVVINSKLQSEPDFKFGADSALSNTVLLLAGTQLTLGRLRTRVLPRRVENWVGRNEKITETDKEVTGVGDVDLGAPILGLSAPKSGNIQRKPKTGAHGATWNVKRGQG